jgi:uncharacterized protein (TIGR00369 family)
LAETAGDYPPAHHLLRDLRLAIDRRDGALRVTAPVEPALFDAAGAVRCGVLGVAIDVYGGNHAIFAAAPDWAVTSALCVQRLRACTRGPLVVKGHALRSGRTQLVIEAAVHDAEGGAPHAVGRMTFTRIPRRADTPPSPADPEPFVSFATADSGLDAPLLDALGVRTADAAQGELELALRAYVRNSVGGLQGGAVVALVEAAAEAAAGARAPAHTVLDAEVQYLAQGRVGPIRSRATRLRESGATALWRVELFDAGQADRLTAVASVLTGALPRA